MTKSLEPSIYLFCNISLTKGVYVLSWKPSRVHKNHRGSGIGKKILEYVIKRSKDRGCHMIQFTSDKKRPNAIEFYKSLGFVNSHEGFKLHL